MAKHGNRSASSQCGAADVLEACGIKLSDNIDFLSNTMSDIGYAFLMAPNHHPCLKPLSVIRKSLGIRTLFNLTGPLLNPANVRVQLIGTYDQQSQETMASAIGSTQQKTAWVVHAQDGMDEVSIANPTRVVQSDGHSWNITPEDFGLKTQALEGLKGGDATFNSQALLRLLDGEDGIYHDAVTLNAALCLMLLKKADNKIDAQRMAAHSLHSGKAKHIFEQYRERSQNAG